MDNITKHPSFWSENDDLVLKSIREILNKLFKSIFRFASSETEREREKYLKLGVNDN